VNILGINAIGHHEASACVIVDGRIVAFAEEERFARSKHAVGLAPVAAVRWCLTQAGLTWADLDALATPWVEEEHGVIAPPGYSRDISFGHRELGTAVDRWPAGIRSLLRATGCAESDAPPLFQVSHHLAHAASAYWCSGYDDAVILVADGEGDRVSTTLAHARQGELRLLRQFSTVDSLGQFYACVTNFLGFGDFGEGKMMGLAPYGRALPQFPEIKVDRDGYHIDLPGTLTRWDPAGTDYKAIIAGWMESLTERFGPARAARERGRPTTLADWPVADIDLAASAQHTLEQTLTHLVRSAVTDTGARNVVVAGGVALNCSANGALADMAEVEGLFVQPAAGDNGVPLGAALHVAALSGARPMHRLQSVALGPSFGPEACAAAIASTGLTPQESPDIAATAAELLAEGQVVCWFDGAMEGGPRALGQRSIVASPGSVAVRDRVNDVKRRARWRPLAPSLCVEDAPDLLGRGGDTPFMIVADTVRPEWHDKAPAIVHVDGSARPHTVDRDRQPAYWSLIAEHKRLTGLPAIINTSFNDETEPIVCTPAEALSTFRRSGADALCLGPYLVKR
jgi:carbamoyltransferase